MLQKALVILFLFSIGACTSTKKTGTTAAKDAKEEKSPFVGSWKVTDFEILEFSGNVPSKAKEGFRQRMKNSTSIEFNEDHSFKSTVADTEESGTWKSAGDNKIVYLIKSGATDTLKVNELTTDTIRGTLNTQKGISGRLELGRVK